MSTTRTFSIILLTCLTLTVAPAAGLPNETVISSTGEVQVVEATDLETAIGNAIAETAAELSDGDASGILQSRPFTVALFGLVSAVLTFLTTNGLKLSTMWLRGRRTLLLAALLSAGLAGGGVFIGAAPETELGTRLLLAASAALVSLGGAVGIHETRRQGQTGARKPERKAGAVVSDTVLQSLIIAGTALPPPFNLAAPYITEMYKKHGAAVVKDMIDERQQRALTGAEIKTDQNAWKAENPVTEAELEAARKKLELRQNPQVREAPADPSGREGDAHEAQ